MSALTLVGGHDVLAPGERSLSELVEAFKREHGEVVSSAAAAVEHAIRAGEALLEAKSKVPHGEWQRWLAANILTDGRRLSTVTAYMRFARNQERLRIEQPRTFRDAALLLRGEGDTRNDPLLADDIRRLRSEGATYQQVADELAVSKGLVWRTVNRKSYEASRRRSNHRYMAAKMELRRRENDAAVRRAGGSAAEAYALVRRALQQLDRAIADEQDREAKRHIVSAIGRLHNVEDQIVQASRLSKRA